MAIRWRAVLVGLGQVVLVVGFGVGLARRWWPLGVPGEWEWLRLPAGAVVAPLPWLVAGATVLGFAGFAAWGLRALGRPGTPWREGAWVTALAVVAPLVQGVVAEGAPSGFGLARWVLALNSPGSSGYATVARREMPEGLGAFLRDYPTWVAGQDSLHIGTHPPGLFIVARGLLDLCRTHPSLVTTVANLAPGSASQALVAAREAHLCDRAEGAALILTGLGTLLAASFTVVPLYLLGRAGGSAAVAWTAATLWPLLPAGLLFLPAADTAFPLLATTSLTLAAWAVAPGTARGLALGEMIAAGLVLALGMELTLAFLAVGLVTAVVLLAPSRPIGWAGRLGLVGATGLGFALGTGLGWWATGANPLAIWWTNQAHHAAFYRDYPRSRGAWTLVNLLESAVAIGLPVVVGACLGLVRARSVPSVVWATLGVLTALTVTGRSLSEVGRLWLPMYPPILIVAAQGMQRLGPGPGSLGWTVLIQGVQVLILLATIQVVYPV